MSTQAMETEPQRAALREIALLGGRLTPGIVQVGDTVRRPPKGNVAFVHDLLLFLEDQGFPFAPRFLGMDEQGREILSYLWAKQTANVQARRIHLMCAAYGWDDPIAIVNDFEADLQQALRNHEQAGRTGAIKVFEEEMN